MRVEVMENAAKIGEDTIKTGGEYTFNNPLDPDDTGMVLNDTALKVLAEEHELSAVTVTAGRFGASVCLYADKDAVIEVYPPYTPIGAVKSLLHLAPNTQMALSANGNSKICRLIAG